MRRALLVAGALWGDAAWAACAAAVSPGELVARLDRAEALYASDVIGDGSEEGVARFLEAAEAVQGGVPCVDAVIPGPLAARVHQVSGLSAFARYELDAAAQAFAGARYADATVPFAAGYVQPGEPEHELYLREDISRPELVALPTSAATRFLVNGRPSTVRPASWPAVLQELDGTGTVLRTLIGVGELDLIATVTWPSPGAEIPEASGPTTPATTAPITPPSRAPAQRRRAAPAALIGASAALAGAGAGWLGYASWMASRACDSTGCHAATLGDTTLTAEQVSRRVKTGLAAGGVMAGVGVIGVAGGAVWFTAGPDGGAVAFSGAF